MTTANESYHRRTEEGVLNSGVKTADVAIKAAPGKVYWITISDVDAASAVQINNSTDDGGTDVWSVELPQNGYIHVNFDPPIECDTGIWLDVSTGSPTIVVGYV